jgi:uncharacterized protein
MNPDFRIRVNGRDVSENIKDRFIRLTLVDRSGLEDDEFELILDRREPRITIPNEGDRVEVSLGYEQNPAYEEYSGVMINHGLFYLNEREINGPRGKTLKLIFNPIDMASRFKEIKNRSFENQTLSQIGQIIARDNGLGLRIDDTLSNIVINHIDQVMENDKSFLSKTIRKYEGVLKVVNDLMIIAKRENLTTFSGKNLGATDIDLTTAKSYVATTEIDSNFSGVKAFYRNEAEADTNEILVGEAGNISSLSRVYPTEEEARRAASAKFNSLKRRTENLSITTIGNPFLKAERVINALGDPDINTKWVTSEVKHSIDRSGGYSVTIDCEAPEVKEKKKTITKSPIDTEGSESTSSIERDDNGNIITPSTGKIG